MLTSFRDATFSLPSLHVEVVEQGKKSNFKGLRCAIDENLFFDTLRMESYFFSKWYPVLYDALILAAAVEFCDRTKARSTRVWGRCFFLHIPVHSPNLWSKSCVAESLRDVLEFLTGDQWRLRFRQRKRLGPQPQQPPLDLGCNVSAVIPFSNGLDSCAAAGLAASELGNSLVRVHLGSKNISVKKINQGMQPFTDVPYKVKNRQTGFRDSSGRSRGFKFALISGIAAFLSGAKRIIVSESGQGALGPSLIPVGQAAPDYRNNPRFGRKMEKFLLSLIGFEGRYEYPHIWDTKGETLARYIDVTGDVSNWTNTRSCWQQNRHVGVKGKARQCGVCAACMLRRLSVRAAGQTEPASTYVWEDLGTTNFEAGASPDFGKAKITDAMRQHAIAGTLYGEHLAALSGSLANVHRVSYESLWLSQALGLRKDIVEKRLERLFAQHKIEWERFMASLGSESFINRWVTAVRP